MPWNRSYRKKAYVNPEREALERRKEAERSEQAIASAQYIQVEGPIPEDVWGGSVTVKTLRSDRDGASIRILRQMPSGGLYIQEAGSIGWNFYPCVYTGE